MFYIVVVFVVRGLVGIMEKKMVGLRILFFEMKVEC